MRKSARTLERSERTLRVKNMSDASRGWLRLTLPLAVSLALWYAILSFLWTQL